METESRTRARRYRHEGQQLRDAVELIQDERLREQLLTIATQYDAAAEAIEQQLETRQRPHPLMADLVCTECAYRINIIRTGPNSAYPEHNFDEFERLCREGPFETLAATGCIYLDAAYLAASRRGDF